MEFKLFEQANQGIFVGLRFTPQSTMQSSQWIEYCASNDRIGRQEPLPYVLFSPVPAEKLHITLATSASPRVNFDQFQPLGKINQQIEFINPKIKFLGGNNGYGYGSNTLCLVFKNDWLVNRSYEIYKLIGVRPKRPFVPHITMSYRSSFINTGWLNSELFPKSVTIMEEFSNPFEANWGHKI